MTDEAASEFFDDVDQFINLANAMTKKRDITHISAVLMYAAARFNAHVIRAVDEDAEETREAAFEYMVGQYTQMLSENFDALGSADELGSTDELGPAKEPGSDEPGAANDPHLTPR